jgi:hypothetical protein
VNPYEDASLNLKCCRNQRCEVPLGLVCQVPDDWTDGNRRKGGVNRNAGYRAELQEPVAPMLREKIKRPKPQDERTDAEHWGGLIRSSDEGSVMGLERRGQVKWS